MARRFFLAMLSWVPAGLIWLAAYITMKAIWSYTEQHGMDHYMAVAMVALMVLGISTVYTVLLQFAVGLFKILCNAWVAHKAALYNVSQR